MIHPTAIIEVGAQLGADCKIMAGAVITRFAIVGDRVVVHPGAVVGGDPQYLKFDPETPSFVRVGSGTTIRENVTINRALHAGQATVIGERCFFMAGSHAGHDCVVGDDVVLANNVMLAGHVTVGAFTFVGGGAGVHQFVRIGESVMVAGLARISCDLAPFTLVAERNEVSGLNLLGLRRRGFPRATIRELKEAFRRVYLRGGDPRRLAAEALAQAAAGREGIEAEPGFTSEEARRFLAFFSEGKRGFARATRLERVLGSDRAESGSAVSGCEERPA